LIESLKSVVEIDGKGKELLEVDSVPEIRPALIHPIIVTLNIIVPSSGLLAGPCFLRLLCRVYLESVLFGV
jgi:hypothetical protein